VANLCHIYTNEASLRCSSFVLLSDHTDALYHNVQIASKSEICMPTNFFEEREEQSVVKARIVQKYFSAWANIVVGTASKMGDGNIAYIDLYAGPGRYKDGAASTPLLVLQEAIKKDRVAQSLIALFNDQDSNNTATLLNEIEKLPGIERLKHKPRIQNNEVGKDAEEYFSKTKIIPSFTFFDPFGYKGLSLKLVNGVIKDWGCDCVFFFNYNRINAGLSNPLVSEHLDALFGEERASELRTKIDGATVATRQDLILQELTNALVEMGAKFVLPFRFKSESGRLTHHLIFVSKHFKGYEVMKDIMHRESTAADQGVASFAYSPADRTMPLLFELSRPIDDLKDMLLASYKGMSISVKDIYTQHSVGRPYILKHYKTVLIELEKENIVTVVDPEGKKRSTGFPDRLTVSFPKEFS
jgi:three-Cys-motif partner protein